MMMLPPGFRHGFRSCLYGRLLALWQQPSGAASEAERRRKHPACAHRWLVHHQRSACVHGRSTPADVARADLHRLRQQRSFASAYLPSAHLISAPAQLRQVAQQQRRQLLNARWVETATHGARALVPVAEGAARVAAPPLPWHVPPRLSGRARAPSLDQAARTLRQVSQFHRSAIAHRFGSRRLAARECAPRTIRRRCRGRGPSTKTQDSPVLRHRRLSSSSQCCVAWRQLPQAGGVERATQSARRLAQLLTGLQGRQRPAARP